MGGDSAWLCDSLRLLMFELTKFLSVYSDILEDIDRK